MMDFDLADLYQVATKRLKEAVRRNRKRFPEDFMFELTKEESDSLRSQFAILMNPSVIDNEPVISKRGRHSKYLPFAFTKHGVTMPASALNIRQAIEMNRTIVRALIALRQWALQQNDLLQQLRVALHQHIDVQDALLNQIYEA